MTEFRANPLYLLAVLSLLIVVSEWLVRRTALRHLGTALLVILFAAVVANLGIIPTSSTAEAPVPLYDGIFAHVAPIAIFYLLLQVNLRDVLRAGLPLIALFLFGAVGTVLGVVIGMRLVNGAETIGPLHGAVAGMFAGTYTGGSVNFNAVALHYGVVREGVLYAGTIVVDNILTTAWFIATLAIPRGLAAAWARRRVAGAVRQSAAPIIDLAAESETIDPRKIALVLALGALAQLASLGIARAFAATLGVNLPPILIITVIALALAQIPAASRLPGARVAGMYGVYLFLAVIGAFCDVRALAGLGTLGVVLLAFATVAVVVHGALTLGAAWLFRMDLEAAAVASQANVGGSTSALALAKSLGREDLLVPGILLGSLGNAIGTFLGFMVVGLV
ncbi:MAG TPA: DUF819 family protein [Gemmatimonadaceae bacterium]|nr:DUF819 family protein [Gemmatimonadaceae bacterium]